MSDSLVFRYNEDASVTSLDPAYMKSQSELWIGAQIFNGLVDLDSNLKPVAMLAHHWEVSEGETVYKFHLRRDVRFCDWNSETLAGRVLNASDVVYSFRRLLDPEVASPGSWIFSDLVNKDSIGRAKTASNDPFYAADDSTFILTLRKPNSSLLQLLGTSYCYIVPKGTADGPKKNEFGRRPVGTGPFYVKHWEEDVKLVLRKNPVYFEFENQKRLPWLEAVNVDFIKNKQTAFMKFVAGDFDFFNGLESSFKDELLTRDGNLNPQYKNKFQFLRKTFLNTEYIGFWLGKSKDSLFYSDKRVRQALSLAINRAELLKYLRNGLGVAGSYGFTPPVLYSEPVTGYTFSQSKAAELLASAGFPNGKGAPPMVVTTTADYLDVAVYIKKYWEALGLQVRIDVQTGGMLRQMRNKGDLAIFRGSWYADYADAENFLACFYSANFSPGGPNYTHFSSREFDRYYEEILKTTDPARRNELVRNADQLIVEEAPVIVLYYDNSLRLFHNHVVGLGNDAANRLILKRVKKSR